MDDRAPVNKNKATQYLSRLCIGVFVLWLTIACLMPGESRTLPFYIVGLAPLLTWFLIKPKRLIGFILAILGLSGLQD